MDELQTPKTVFLTTEKVEGRKQLFIPIIGETGADQNHLEQASRKLGEWIRREGLGANECATLFTVLAVRAARIAGASKEGFMNYASKMWDEKSDIDEEKRRRNPNRGYIT